MGDAVQASVQALAYVSAYSHIHIDSQLHLLFCFSTVVTRFRTVQVASDCRRNFRVCFIVKKNLLNTTATAHSSSWFNVKSPWQVQSPVTACIPRYCSSHQTRGEFYDHHSSYAICVSSKAQLVVLDDFNTRFCTGHNS